MSPPASDRSVAAAIGRATAQVAVPWLVAVRQEQPVPAGASGGRRSAQGDGEPDREPVAAA